MSSPTFLITGANGQVGWELQRSLSALATTVAVDRDELDLIELDSVRRFVRQLRPSLILNAAAYTAVDQAEREPELARKLNAVVPRVLAEEAKRLNAVFISYSTDYVFDGAATRPYTEESSPHPLGIYGQTKLEGDNAIADVGGSYLIFRTAWVYGTRGKNFYLTMLRLAGEGKEVRVVDDQVGCPTWSHEIARATAQVIAQLNSAKSISLFDAVSEVSGIYNLVSTGQTSWFGFAKAIFESNSIRSRLTPITSDQYPTAAPRPRYSVLSTRKLEQTFGIRMAEWRESLAQVMGVSVT
jgi:dTDP-4-dehydrorhamnose reductase